MTNYTKNYTKKPLFIIAFLLWTTYAMAQVGIGTVIPDTSAALDITSTTRGVLIPRLNSAQVTSLAGKSPAEGLLVYNTSEKCIQIYSGTSFQCLITGSASDTTNDAWVNDPANNMVKLGTNSNGSTARPDSNNLVIKDDGKVGIGTSNPRQIMHIASYRPVLTLQDNDNSSLQYATMGYIQFMDSAGLEYAWIGEGSPTSNIIGISNGRPNGNISFYTSGNGATRMIIDSAGLVGIGTNLPKSTLQVNGFFQLLSALQAAHLTILIPI